jgi:hypothetical protein
MSVSQIATAAVALCSGLLLASFIMAEQADAPLPSAQMNRGNYKKASPAPVVQMRHRPVTKRVALPVVSAQMNRSLYGK